MTTTQAQLSRCEMAQDVAAGGSPRRRVAVVTGSRAEFGLLAPVMHAVQNHPSLTLRVIGAGSHLLKPAETIREVAGKFEVAFTVPMQVEGDVGRVADARALGRGVSGFTEAFSQIQPDWVLVLGDRIEAFAAACAASVGGWALAHSHGGDRAEGVADEAMRHAITKLAHVHAAASPASADRIIRMGERPESVVVTGSPAIDGLEDIRALDDVSVREFGDPDVLLLLHPTGRSDEEEEAEAREVIEGVRVDSALRVLALEPNFDPGREGVMRALQASGIRMISHLERKTFVGLLRRVRVLVGNSSAGLIEAAAVGCPVVNVGRRQAGRLCPENVVTVDPVVRRSVNRALRQAEQLGGSGPFRHPYGDGCAGMRIAALLATIDPHDGALLRKRNSY